MKVVGVDHGLTGALALVEDWEWESYADITATEARLPDMDAVIEYLVDVQPDLVIAEKLWGRQQSGCKANFLSGYAMGALTWVCDGLGMPLRIVTPHLWQKTLGVYGKDKEGHRQRALELCGELAAGWLKRKKDHDRADAFLLALLPFVEGEYIESDG